VETTQERNMFIDDEAFDEDGIQRRDNTKEIDDHVYQPYDDMEFRFLN
jgi:hypothetical protein